jgi:hypothetical protein
MTATFAILLIVALLVAAVIADSLWGGACGADHSGRAMPKSLAGAEPHTSLKL